MNDQMKLLQSVAAKALGPIWNVYAKEGKESAIFAPLARSPNAAAWLSRCLRIDNYYINRKIGAMLAGWIDDPRHVGLLPAMLGSEREVFRTNPTDANSVGEDIMFAATRWSESQKAEIRHAGTGVLAGMIGNALQGTPWNTVHWAVANLYRATDGKHEIFPAVAAAAAGSQLDKQQFFKKAAIALKDNDKQVLARFVTAPSPLHSLSSEDPYYAEMKSLWDAAASAEAVWPSARSANGME